jgi:hypothetical protein
MRASLLANLAAICVLWAPRAFPADGSNSDGSGERGPADGRTGDGAKAMAVKNPDVARFILADGSEIAGKVTVKSLTVNTAYGKLVVPLAEVRRLRVGRGRDEETRKRVAALILKLGSSDFNQRQGASKELVRMGADALDQLRAAVKSDDAEIRTRAGKIAAQIREGIAPEDEEEDSTRPLAGDEDELVTRRFTAKGRLELDQFEVATNYGRLVVPCCEVICAIFSEPEEKLTTLKVQGHQTVRAPLRTRVKLKKGEAVKITASGSINFTNWRRTIPPEGDPRYGTYNGKPKMCLLYRVGGSGQYQPVGRSTSFKAKKSGELCFCVNYSSNPGNCTGAWRVKVAVRPRQ